MTFQSLSALTSGPSASSVAKSQENGAVRPERTGPAGRDFSTFLSQAMLSKDWTGNNGMPRQGLADLGTQVQEPAAQEASRQESSSTGSDTAMAKRNASDAASTRNDTRANTSSPGTNQELTQRALRTANLRAAQNRAEGAVGGRSSSADLRPRKTGPRKEDDTHTNTASGNPMAVPPPAWHHPVTEAVHTASTNATSAVASETSGSAAINASNEAQASSPLTFQVPLTGADTPAGQSLARGADGLTTVQLSPHMQIITSGQGVVNEQSLQAFAQSMGIDASQFKQLVTAAPAGSVDASGLRAGVTATDALMGTPILPAAPTDVTALDLSQVLPAGMSFEDLHIDWKGGQRSASADASLSTLEVLGMRDSGLSPDAVTSSSASADAGTQNQHSDNTGGMNQSNLGASARTAATTAHAATAPTAQNMAEHFEKLSAKLATEMAGRIHEQFSQGEWKMKFALKPASLGQVDVQLEMRDGKLAAVLQADNPMTQDLLQNGSQRLRDALSQMGLSQSSVLVGDGRSQAFQGDRHSGSHGAASTAAQHQDSPDESVQTVASTPRRNSLSQLDFYA